MFQCAGDGIATGAVPQIRRSELDETSHYFMELDGGSWKTIFLLNGPPGRVVAM